MLRRDACVPEEAEATNAPAFPFGRWLRLIAVSAGVIAIDQSAKALATGALAPGEAIDLPLGFQLTEAENRGVALGLFAGAEGPIVAATLLVIALVLGWFASRPTARGAWLALGLVLGGIVSNLIDRIRTGAVVDFIDAPTQQWTQFNLADVSILIGLGVLLFATMRASDRAA